MGRKVLHETVEQHRDKSMKVLDLFAANLSQDEPDASWSCSCAARARSSSRTRAKAKALKPGACWYVDSSQVMWPRLLGG